jgi:hypothetical protein
MKKQTIVYYSIGVVILIAIFFSFCIKSQSRKTQSEVAGVTMKLEKLFIGMHQSAALKIMGEPTSKFRFTSEDKNYEQLTFNAPEPISDLPELIFSFDSTLVFIGFGEKMNAGKRPRIEKVFPNDTK